ncbi:glutamine amidotransferase [Pseudomonas sp. B2M1-30]|uniref:glutamine amidotransferase n=1 Tax=Pseudomonas TaxID=286 RepID=UPI0021C8A1ED|nr:MULTISPECIES: glutamine amidotransferase [Pseudomonas]MCU0116916.1 glutamine amidotransferase [Pseudomonas sp. B2M1-30]MCU7260309.1 glutamine amidotransferase [Pseudomonas koreensis]
MYRLPIIGVTDCSQQSGLHAHHISGDTSVNTTARKTRGLSSGRLSMAGKTSASDILDARDGTLFTASPSNIDRFHSSSLCRAGRRVQCVAHDSARPGFAQEMQRQRKGQVSSPFIVYARCQA